MLNKSFGVIYFHFNIFSTKTAKKKKRVKNLHFWVFKNVSQTGPFHTTWVPNNLPPLLNLPISQSLWNLIGAAAY